MSPKSKPPIRCLLSKWSLFGCTFGKCLRFRLVPDQDPPDIAPDPTNCHALTWVCVVLALCVMVFFHSFFFAGRVYSGNDIAYTYAPFSQDKPPGFTGFHNGLLYDQVRQFYPMRRWWAECIRRGVWPRWNPYVLCGNSYVGNIQSQAYYPPNLLAVVLPATLADTIVSMFELFFSGLGTALLLRRLNVRPTPALFGGVSYMFCSYQIAWMNHPHASVSAYLPWLLLCISRIVDALRPGRRDIAALGLVVALAVTGGHPGTLAHIMFLGGCFAVFILARQFALDRSLWAAARRMGALSGGVLLGAGATAIVTFPFLSYLYGESITFDQHMNAAVYDTAIPLSGLLPAILPKIFGSIVGWHDNAYANAFEGSMFVGTSPLLLIAAGLLLTRPRATHLFFVGCSLAIAAAIVGVEPFSYVLRRLPMIRHAHFNRLVLVVQFANAVAGAIGLDSLVTSMAKRPKNKCRCFAALFSLFVAGGIAIWMLYPRVRGMWELAITCMLVGSFGLLAVWKPRLARLLPMGMTVLVFAELYHAHSACYPPLPLEVAELPEPALARELRAKSPSPWFRMAASDETFGPDLNQVFGLRDVRGYELPMAKRYVEFMASGFYGDRWIWGINYAACLNAFLAENNRQLLSLMGVRFVLSSSWDGNAPVHIVLENTNCCNHAFLPRQAVVSSGSLKEDLRLLRKGEVALVDKPGFMPVVDGNRGMVETLSEDVNGAAFQIHTQCRTVLIFNEMPLAGWQATVDGKKASVFPVNWIQIGVEVAPGTHVVEFIFLPKSFVVGAWVSLASLFFMGTLAVSCIRNGKKHKLATAFPQS